MNAIINLILNDEKLLIFNGKLIDKALIKSINLLKQ